MKQFGGRVTKRLIERYSQSPNWKNDKFMNLVETTLQIHFHKVPKLLYKQLCKGKGRVPRAPIPVIPFPQSEFVSSSKPAKLVWYGHSAVLMRMANTTILIDPMFGSDAAPTAPFSVRRFSKHTLNILDEVPPIDLVLLTHDHYDHLDLASIKKLRQKTGHFFVALGVARHLINWGIDPSKITEFDWWNTHLFGNLSITFTPTRHFSGRGLTDRAKSLWGGWVLKTEKESIYFSGDSGYGPHFKEVGKKLGPFDFGLMECGQYNENWHQIHMFPEESVQAALDAKVAKAMPVHWGGFALAQHSWKEPVQRFVREAAIKRLQILTPRVGELVTLADKTSISWWNSVD